MASEIQIVRGLSDDDRQRAAEIIYEAFRGKLRFAGSRRSLLPALAKALRSDRAICAYLDGRLLGIVGVDYGGQNLLAARWHAFCHDLGLLRGTLDALLISLMAWRDRRDDLYISSLAVAPEFRGRGIGTQLLSAAESLARELRFRQVSLNVVNTNPRARALYVRLGYRVVRQHRYPFTRRLMGFSYSDMMVKDLPQS